MGKNKTITAIVLTLLLTIISVEAYSGQAVFNYTTSQTPISSYYDLNITLMENKTAYFTQGKTNESLNISYIQNITFTSNTAVLRINYTLGNLAFGDKRELVSTILIKNNYNNISIEFALIFNVTGEPLVSFVNSTAIQIQSSGYNRKISEDMLPMQETLDFKLATKKGDIITIKNCHLWLSCPETIEAKENITTLPIKYTIPFNAQLGIHNLTFEANNSNNSVKGNILIEIIKSELAFRNLVMDIDQCLKSENDLKRCSEMNQQYFQNLLKAYYDLNYNRSKINDTKVIEKMVMVGSIDEQIKALYDSCKLDLDGSRTELTSCVQKREAVTTEKNNYMNEINNLKEQIKQERNYGNLTAENILKQNEKKKTRNYIIGSIIGVLAILILLYIRHERKHNGLVEL